MFEEIPYILGFMLLSLIISYLLLNYSPEPFVKIIKALSMGGIVIHEICHVLMCFMTHSPIEHASLLKKVEGEKDPDKLAYYGQVKIYEDKVSFLQAFLVSFAPLYLSFWLFFSVLSFIIYNKVEPWLFILCVFLMITLILAASPSVADLVIIPKAFYYDVGNSLYEILLLLISLLITFFTVFSLDMLFLHEIIIYFIIAGFYFMFKYGFRLIRNVFFAIYERKTNRIDKPIIQNKGILYRRRKPWQTLRLKKVKILRYPDFGTQD